MSYITIAEYMQYAWVTTLDTNTSNQVAILLPATKAVIDWVIGDVSYWQKTEKIKYCDVVRGQGGYGWYDTIECLNIWIKSLDEINGRSYTGILDTAYQITPPMDSRIVIRDLATYVNALIFDYFTIKYTSGFQTIPDDIKYLQYLLVVWEQAKQSGQEVSRYTMWPRTLVFKDQVSMDMAKMTLGNYFVIRI